MFSFFDQTEKNEPICSAQFTDRTDKQPNRKNPRPHDEMRAIFLIKSSQDERG